MKVLLTTDGSPCSQHALREAMRLLPLDKADVTLVSVTPPPLVGMDPVIGYGIADGLTESLQLEQDTQATHHAMAAAQALLEAGGVRPAMMERQGDPASAILDLANAMHPDLIVVGSHGRGPIGRLISGSVSEALVHRWHGAVLVVPPNA